MNTTEIKKDLHTKIDTLSDSQLEKVQEFINYINKPEYKEWNVEDYITNIVNEREEVLKKLAK